jgi:hypothetical protein
MLSDQFARLLQLFAIAAQPSSVQVHIGQHQGHRAAFCDQLGFGK